ncbi:hypothetical protein TCON_0692 [Astathelohania contejeani]|uniref:Uncharacterized protein n=1 Tax=Astathelohania contejeani TaxID=164912 RepID=A0ABQ7I0X8_9MICR|nr:hypothetical protein TCON_0692 [Thelohania contejeani]
MNNDIISLILRISCRCVVRKLVVIKPNNKGLDDHVYLMISSIELRLDAISPKRLFLVLNKAKKMNEYYMCRIYSEISSHRLKRSVLLQSLQLDLAMAQVILQQFIEEDKMVHKVIKDYMKFGQLHK